MTITFNHLNNIPTISLIEPYCQTYTYDTGNNLTHLSHQANSGDWQQHFIKLVYIGWFGSGSGLIGDNLLKSIGVGAIIPNPPLTPSKQW
jgi:hypothetical protein